MEEEVAKVVPSQVVFDRDQVVGDVEGFVLAEDVRVEVVGHAAGRNHRRNLAVVEPDVAMRCVHVLLLLVAFLVRAQSFVVAGSGGLDPFGGQWAWSRAFVA